MTSRSLHITAAAFTLAAIGAAAEARAPQSVPEDFVIRIERTPCYLQCPVYSVTIDAHGDVTYKGTRFVRTKGRQVDRILVSRVAELYEATQRIGVFDLRDQYRLVHTADGSGAVVMDLPGTIVTVTAGSPDQANRGLLRRAGELERVRKTCGGDRAYSRWVSGVQQFARLR